MRLLTILSILLILSGCSTLERVTTERTVEIDTIHVKVPRPPVQRTHVEVLAETLTINDPKLRLDIIRLPSDSTAADSSRPKRDSLKIDYTIKRDTVRVPVPQKTITEKKTAVRVEQETPWWNWIIIGGLLAIALILAAAWRLGGG